MTIGGRAWYSLVTGVPQEVLDDLWDQRRYVRMTISSGTNQYQLALNILLEHFGPVVQDVADVLLRKGKSSLTELRRHLDAEYKRIKFGQLKEALAILTQHNMLRVCLPSVEELARIHPRVYVCYDLELDAITLRLRFPRFLYRAKELFGAEGEAVLEELVLHGRLNMSQIKKNVHAKLLAKRLEAAAASADPDTDAGGAKVEQAEAEQLERSIGKAAEEMIKARYVVRVVPFNLLVPDDLSSGKDKKRGAGKAGDGPERVSRPQARKRRMRDADSDQEDNVPIEIAMMMQHNGGAKPPGAAANGHAQAAANGSATAANGSNSSISSSVQASPGSAPSAAKRARAGLRGRGRGRGAPTGRGGVSEPSAGLVSHGEQDHGTEGHREKAGKEEELKAGDDLLWKVGADQFHRDFRHTTCARFVKQKVNTTAESLVKAILKASMPFEKGVASDRTQSVAAEDIASQVQLSPGVTLRMYMDLLRNDQVRIVGDGGESGRYYVNMGNIIEALRQRTVYSIIRRRYERDEKGADGVRNARIVRVLLDKKYLEQQQLSELAMMSLRETRERLYTMYRDEVVTFQEVPKRADHHPNQTFYLWTFNMKHVVKQLVDQLYKGALNLRLRRQKEVEEKSDLLANKDNIKDDVEARHFDSLTIALDQLDQASINLEETIMLFTVF